MTAPQPVSEYVIAEVVDGKQRRLSQCGSWYSDRHYTDDLTGHAAATAAAERVAAQVPGEYVVLTERTFTR